MSIFSSFAFEQNLKNICETQLFFSGDTTQSYLLVNTPYYRVLQDASGTPIQFGYWSWIPDSQATFVSGTAPDGKDYAVYKTNTGSNDYMVAIVFRIPPTNFYRGIGFAQIGIGGGYNTYFTPSENRSARVQSNNFEEWNSKWYPRSFRFAGPSATNVLKYPGVCPPFPTATPTPTPTATSTPTPTPTSTPTPTPTSSPTPTPTVTSTPTPTPTFTITPTPIPTTGYTSGFTILVNDSSASYPGTGTTWTSLATGTTYNGTLTNGPVWSGGTPGYFTFDGTNDFVNFGLSSTGATTASSSFGAWFNVTTSATQKVIAMRGLDGSGNGWSLFISKQSNNKMGVGVVTTSAGLQGWEVNSTTTLVSNTWYNVYGVWTSGTNLKIYVNGVLENTLTVTPTGLRTSGFGWTLSRANTSTYTNSNIGEFITYNNVLTDAEVLNNFNYTKSKYGY